MHITVTLSSLQSKVQGKACWHVWLCIVYRSSLDALELAGIQSVFCEATPLLQQHLSAGSQCTSHLAHLHQHHFVDIAIVVVSTTKVQTGVLAA